MKLLQLFILGIVINNYITIHAQSTLSSDRKQLLDYGWKFALGDYPSAFSGDFNDNNWNNIDLPHDWSIEGKTNPKNNTGGGGGYFPAGLGWYRKKFTAPNEWKNKKISIYFEGVYMNSEVYINGKSLGVHPYGYTSFVYDVTPYLVIGKENIIGVKVNNSQQMNSRWYSGSGIYRHVWLIVTNPVHIDQWGVAISTTSISHNKATVEVKSYIKNETSFVQKLTISSAIKDNKAKNKETGEVHIELDPHSDKEVIQQINIANPHLWTPETPYLYNVQIRVISESKVIDTYQNTFGIRTLNFTPEKGFELNGKTIKINGGCVHHDNGCLGAAAFDRAEERKVELLKSGGFNTVRTSHNPPSEAFLDACDRMGLMVIDESFDCWEEAKNPYDYAMFFRNWWQSDLESMVLRDRNHPSVIMWSIGNEIIERKKPEAVITAHNMVNVVHAIDKTRPVTSAMTTWDKSWEIFDPLMAAHDVCGYNYQIHRAVSDHQRVPARIILQTESYPRDAFNNWKMVQDYSYIIGDVVWTAIDYLGESGIGRWYYPGEPKGEHWEVDLFPWHGAYCGDIDITGWRKPISHYRSMLYNNTEKLYMAVKEPNPDNGPIRETMWSVWPTWESWTWPDHEGKDIQVEVYSKYQKVQLYLNNKLVGEQVTNKKEEFKAIFTIPYNPGILKAIGINDDKKTESKILRTAGKASRIKLTADRTEIKANGQDLSFITIELTDEQGTVQPNTEESLLFTVTGPGKIAGVANANLKDTDSYYGNSRKTWHGRAMVVLKSTSVGGTIKLKVHCTGLNDAEIIIKSGKK